MNPSSTRRRPAGRSPGTGAFIGAWAVGVAIARLTGAAAVVLLLVGALVGFVGLAIAGWWRLRSVEIVGITAPRVTTVGDPTAVIIDHHDPSTSRADVWLDIDGVRVAVEPGCSATVEVTPERAGVIRSLPITLLSAGAPGCIWWKRRVVHSIDPIHVAPRSVGPRVAIDRIASPTLGETAPGDGAKTGDVDGSRPWRPGESEQAIHWPSTMRSGEVIAHDRTPESDTRWHVDLDADPGRLRYTLEEGLRLGHHVTLSTGADDADVVIDSVDHARHWSAIAADRTEPPTAATGPRPVWSRQLSLGPRLETITEVGIRPRLATAAAAMIALWMLLDALTAGPLMRTTVIAGLVAATGLSLRFTDGTRPLWARLLTVGAAIAALAWIALQTSGIGGLLEALRGPMPDLLMVLVVLHGAEIADRRTNRVHLAVTGVVTAYAVGLRLDGTVGWWMIAWAVVAIVATCTTDRHETTSHRRQRVAVAQVATWSIAGLVATLALASLVPIPDGPASLGLPALSDDSGVIDEAGALVGPDGSPASSSTTRGALGQVGGYPGFSDTLDTAVRGDLGDEVVLRVRAPEAAFWRGQTFTEFDGRVWTVSDDALERTIEGPRIELLPTIGDGTADGVPVEEFVQTFFVEADLPNVVFAATRAAEVIFDGTVTHRSDGALRADRTLNAGTVYSVVSERVEVTAELLQAQGDVAERFAPFADRAEVTPFLEVPESTSVRTIALADELRVEGSTYRTVLAYERWIAQNTGYDLDAPVPDGDAVDDFLFESQRGFCEQIASSLVVMLRSQGVPARLATGYIPGERDRISGVFEVKASDAHAWVEVWFPDTGWQAFDPTAAVPLAGEAERSTVGGDAAGAVLDAVFGHPVEAALLVAAGFAGLALVRAGATLRRRRRRGPWGVLTDRFMALAPEATTAPQAGRDIDARLGADDAEAADIARRLDRVAFDSNHTPDVAERTELSRRVAALERRLRRVPDGACDKAESRDPVGATSR